MVVPQPSLYVLATHHKYNELVIRLKENSHGTHNAASLLDWADMNGNTVLHILCRQSSLSKEAIKAVIEKKPSLAGRSNQACWTPLHLACERRHNGTAAAVSKQQQEDRSTTEVTTEILLMLVHACPQAVSLRRESGYARETPFDMACAAHVDIQVLREMLSIDPRLALPLVNHRSNKDENLKALWTAKLTKHMELILLTALFGRVVNVNEGSIESSFLVHAACLQRVPRAYLEDILLQHKDNLLLPNPQNGNLPLHYAVSQHDAPQPFVEFLVTSLVTHAPAAVEVLNREGRYPLHCALDHHGHHPFLKHGRVLLRLLCRPATLATRDPITKLYPLQMAARYANLSRAHHSTLYDLLLAAPQIVRTGIV